LKGGTRRWTFGRSPPLVLRCSSGRSSSYPAAGGAKEMQIDSPL
jgi:hypothetical protein